MTTAVRVELELDDVAMLRRYLGKSEVGVVEAAVAYLLDNPRAVKDWLREGGDADGVRAVRLGKPGLTIPADVAKRAATEATYDPETGCEISSEPVNVEGYARVKWTEPATLGKNAKAHTTMAARAAFVHYYGPVPDGRRVQASCGDRRCVAKDHLDLKGRQDYQDEGRR